MRTRQQRIAELAFGAVTTRTRSKERSKEYNSFAKSFPSLIQTAGLCQATAFALAKGKDDNGRLKPSGFVLQDVAQTMGAFGTDGNAAMQALLTRAREADVSEYLHLSRLALQAATWVKRYVEALPGDTQRPPAEQAAERD